MMTETQAEYTKSAGDKAKVWDTIQKEVLVRGREGQIVYSTQWGGVWGRVYTQTKHFISDSQRVGWECIFLKGGWGEGGFEVRSHEDGSRGWQGWEVHGNARQVLLQQ